MGRLNRVRCALIGGVAGALLVACGGPQSVNPALQANGARELGTHHKKFIYTGGKQSFKVPAGVTKLTIVAVGALGGGYPSGAAPGRTRAIVPVTPGEKLAVFVGGQPTYSSHYSYAKGGFNGGGQGGLGFYTGYGGGGASDVRQGGDTLKDRIVIAGGGGGEASNGGGSYGGLGGQGGGRHGGAGEAGGSSQGGGGGGGGTQHAGGAGGTGGYCSGYRGISGSSGSLGAGGAGGYGNGSGPPGQGAGGGGGGYYGGGGGAGGCDGGAYAGGGGGGSGYVEPGAYAGRTSEGWKGHSSDPNGFVVFSW